jgi:SH3-like domain-containing protein
LPAVIGTSLARLHTEPHTSAAVVTTLKRGVQVSLLERRGNWARVHVDSSGGKAPSDGWIFAASLRESAHH